MGAVVVLVGWACLAVLVSAACRLPVPVLAWPALAARSCDQGERECATITLLLDSETVGLAPSGVISRATTQSTCMVS